jgi:hypothetical protein
MSNWADIFSEKKLSFEDFSNELTTISNLLKNFDLNDKDILKSKDEIIKTNDKLKKLQKNCLLLLNDYSTQDEEDEMLKFQTILNLIIKNIQKCKSIEENVNSNLKETFDTNYNVFQKQLDDINKKLNYIDTKFKTLTTEKFQYDHIEFLFVNQNYTYIYELKKENSYDKNHYPITIKVEANYYNFYLDYINKILLYKKDPETNLTTNLYQNSGLFKYTQNDKIYNIIVRLLFLNQKNKYEPIEKSYSKYLNEKFKNK